MTETDSTNPCMNLGCTFENNEKLQCKFKLENEQSFLQEEGENETND